MELLDCIRKDLIKMKLISRDKLGVLKEMVSLLGKTRFITNEEKVLNAAIEREKKGTTGLGHGIAIPHIQSNAVKRPVIVFGRSPDGVDYEAMDNKPTHLFFLIAVPEHAHDEYLNLLSQLSRKLVSPESRDALKNAVSPDEVVKILSE